MQEHPLNQQQGIRSYVRRDGRITAAQSTALAKVLPALELAWPLQTHDRRFLEAAPLALEIGCGNGEFLWRTALASPDTHFIGAEVHRPGLGRLANLAARHRLRNLRLFTQDVNFLVDQLPDGALVRVFIFFPDPWPKTRHHKRRLLNATFLSSLARVVARHGRVFIATDIADYAESIAHLLRQSPEWTNLAAPADFAPRYKAREITRFEARALAARRQIFEFVAAQR